MGMANRKQRELADDYPDVVGSDTSGFGEFKNYFYARPIWKTIELGRGKNCSAVSEDSRGHRSEGVRGEKETGQDAVGFGGSEVLKNCYPAHPIWKTIQVAEGKNCYDLASSISQFPRGQRSKRIERRRNATGQDAGILHGSPKVCILEESRCQGHFDVPPHKPRNARGKRKAESNDSEVISKYSPCCVRQSRRLKLSNTDIQKLGRLDSHKFEFYIENIWRRFTEEKKNVFTHLDCLWFSFYTKGALKEKVLGWIKKKDLFSKKYVFVPIVMWGHWFLLIFCHFAESPESTTRRRCMLLLDSLQKAHSKQLESGIRRFVFDIFKTEERPVNKQLINKIPLLIPKVPQQQNGEECGYFVLYYINLFLESAPDNFSLSTGYPYFMKEDWFTPEEVERFFERLDSLNKSSASSD